jgi:hypothetical protein
MRCTFFSSFAESWEQNTLLPPRFRGGSTTLEPIRPNISTYLASLYNDLLDQTSFAHGIGGYPKLATFSRESGGMHPSLRSIISITPDCDESEFRTCLHLYAWGVDARHIRVGNGHASRVQWPVLIQSPIHIARSGKMYVLYYAPLCPRAIRPKTHEPRACIVDMHDPSARSALQLVRITTIILATRSSRIRGQRWMQSNY